MPAGFDIPEALRYCQQLNMVSLSLFENILSPFFLKIRNTYNDNKNNKIKHKPDSTVVVFSVFLPQIVFFFLPIAFLTQQVLYLKVPLLILTQKEKEKNCKYVY